MANIEERIKSMQEAVEDAKRGVRATMTVEELSRESIRDIVKEVSETNTALDAVFNEGTKEVSVNTRHLRSELMKLIEGGGDASKERLKEIEQKARDIAQVALEESPEEAEYLGQLAANVQGAARKARKAASGLGGNMIGESLFTGIFGQQFGGWLLSPGQKRGRGQAETLLDLRQNELETLTGGGGGETPSEVAEEKREQEIRQVEVERKEDTVITLLNRILLLLGKNGVSDSSSSGGGGGGGTPIIPVATGVAVGAGLGGTTVATVGTKTGRQFLRNLYSIVRYGPTVARQFSTLAQRPGTQLARNVLRTPKGPIAASLTDNLIHIAEDGIRVTINKNGQLVVRNAAGHYLEKASAAKYLKNLGLPHSMPAGSTIDDVFKVATRGLSKNASQGFLKRFITGFGRAGLKTAAAAEGVWAAVFATYDFGTGMIRGYQHMASGGDFGLTHRSMDVQAGLIGAADMVHGLNWVGETVGLPGSGQSTEELAQGIEHLIFGTDLSKLHDNMLRSKAMASNRKKTLDSMAGGFDSNSTIGKRLLYTGQYMKLLLDKKANPDMKRAMVDVDGSTKSKNMSWQQASEYLLRQSAIWIEIEEAERNNRPHTEENIQNIEAALKGGNFKLQGNANEGGVSLIPWASRGHENQVMYGREMQHKLRTSGGVWAGVLNDLGNPSIVGSGKQAPNLYQQRPIHSRSDGPHGGVDPVMFDGSSVHNNFVLDDTVELERLREVDPNTVNITLD